MASCLMVFPALIFGRSESNPYTWTCGQDSRISHRKPIGSGGYAEVHEVKLRYSRTSKQYARCTPRIRKMYSSLLTLMTSQAFARKILRISHRVPEEDIKNEARVISSIHENGGHKNIIGILDHGWLKGSFNVYYIDMELAQLTLADYIDHLRGAKHSSSNIVSDLSPVFVNPSSSFERRVHNIWVVGRHVAEGLNFMHANKHVHRDLKPTNGKNFYSDLTTSLTIF